MYQVAVISLGRSQIIKTHTIKMLQDNNIDMERVTVFVVEEEKDLYQLPCKTIVGVRGIVQQREFVENYYDEGANILCLDDDIKMVDYKGYDSLDNFINYAFSHCSENGASIWSVYPVFNPFFRKGLTSKSLKVMIGAFYGIINRRIPLEITRESGEKEDVERSIKYFIRDKIVIRHNQVGFKTTYFGKDGGGLGKREDRIAKSIINVALLNEKYGKYGKIKVRKDGYNEFVLNQIPHTPPDSKVIKLQYYDDFDKLRAMLSRAYIPMKSISTRPRRGFGKHQAATVGMTLPRFKKQELVLSAFSKKYPEIHDEIFRIGWLFVPFDFTKVHINKNVLCPPHYDSKNVGESVLISFGDYQGGEIVIDGVEYNAFHTPLMFNGSAMEHYNKPFVGEKYSLVFYN